METLVEAANGKTTRHRISEVHVSAYTIPTDRPESDGTLEWQETTIIVVKVRASDKEGLGYTYGHIAIVDVIQSLLTHVIMDRDAMDVMGIQTSMIQQIRNNGQAGLAMMGVSAVDMALWDLKAKLLGLPLCRLLGQEHEGMQIYGSGGFTSYTEAELRQQLEGWATEGIAAVKIKVGRDMEADKTRVGVARDAIGERTELYVDANGAYTVSEALEQAELFAPYGVDWLEEPVPAQSREQLHLIRQRLGGGMRIVAGEYGYALSDFRDLLEARAVDVLQADATRCGGITGFLKAGSLCEAWRVPLSSHCAPSAHLHAAVALSSFSIGEYFYDHVRIERLLFDGAAVPRDGVVYPDLGRPGLGLMFRDKEAESYRCA
ncbi:MAG TPA: enolase C-terminal domain-like protein [Puia sp.]|nr:enolase C-terminal domain-like protein [Puia sp.]